MEKTTVFDVAHYFLYLSIPGTKQSITPLKLQKLAFYTQALSFAINKRKLFDEEFEAWVHGPVSPSLYYEYKKYGSNEIDKKFDKPNISGKDEVVIKIVWKMFGKKDGKFLENRTHNEKPWQEARKDLNYYDHSNKVIEKSCIQKYYSKKFKVNKIANN